VGQRSGDSVVRGAVHLGRDSATLPVGSGDRVGAIPGRQFAGHGRRQSYIGNVIGSPGGPLAHYRDPVPGLEVVCQRLTGGERPPADQHRHRQVGWHGGPGRKVRCPPLSYSLGADILPAAGPTACASPAGRATGLPGVPGGARLPKSHHLPANECFWPVQGVESGIFLILALALAIFTYWSVTTREA
jgi:hypothetical protein